MTIFLVCLFLALATSAVTTLVLVRRRCSRRVVVHELSEPLRVASLPVGYVAGTRSTWIISTSNGPEYVNAELTDDRPLTPFDGIGLRS